MDILTLELLDVTVFQALVELRSLLTEHPGEALLVRGEDDMLRINVAGFLEKQGRGSRLVQNRNRWELHVAALSRSAPVPIPSVPVPAPPPSLPPRPRPVLLLRSAFAPGDRALGRRLLLETLSRLEPGTPWLCLAHQAVELLEDPGALVILQGLKGRGIPVQVSLGSLLHAGLESPSFEAVPDEAWQKLLVQGQVTVL